MALRQQLAVLRRGVTRPKLEDQDRLFWIGMLRMLDIWPGPVESTERLGGILKSYRRAA